MIQDEATTVSRAAKAATAAATDYHTGTATTIRPTTNRKTNHAATDHQSAERSVMMFTMKNHNLEQLTSVKKHCKKIYAANVIINCI